MTEDTDTRPEDTDTLPQLGDVVAGKYRIERELGRGGMGVVVAATHTKLDQQVAIKFVTAEASEGVLKRFEREGRVIAKLKGAHVAGVHDVGELDDGTPYLVMEYLEGQDLHQLTKKLGALPPDTAVEYILEACEAVAEAHAAGIVHRDLKPANLFLTTAADGTPTIKVLDFGISKDTNIDSMPGAGEDLTKTSMLLGTPHYMAPEQMRSARDVDGRADIWSLGAILYQLITAKRPFAANSFAEIVAKVLQVDPAPASEKQDAVPVGLDAVIAQCLAKDPEARFSDVALLAESLVPFGPPGSEDIAVRCERLLARVSYGSIPLSSRRRSVIPPRDSRTSVDTAPPFSSADGPEPLGHSGAEAASEPPGGEAEAPAAFAAAPEGVSAAVGAISLSRGKGADSDTLESPAVDRGDTAAAVTASPRLEPTPHGSSSSTKWIVAAAVAIGLCGVATVALVGTSTAPSDVAPAASVEPEEGVRTPSAAPAAGEDEGPFDETPPDEAAPAPESPVASPPRRGPPERHTVPAEPSPPEPAIEPEPEPPAPEPTAEPAKAPPPPPPKTTPPPPPPPPKPPPKKNPLDMDLK